MVLINVFELINLSINAFSLLKRDFMDIFFESDLIFFTVTIYSPLFKTSKLIKVSVLFTPSKLPK